MTSLASAPLTASTPQVAASVVASHSIPWLPSDASWLSILQACIPVVIAAMVAWVGWRQLVTAKAKLNLDLFEKRMDVFEIVLGALTHGAAQRAVPEPELREMLEAAPSARFLYGESVDAYIQEIAQKNFELNRLLVERHKAGNIMNSPEHQAVMTCQMWFAAQRVECVKLFEPFLSFEKWR